MKKILALFLSAVLLLSAVPVLAFAGLEYADTYDTALNLAKNDLTNLGNLSDAVAMLGRLGSYSFSKNYLRYFQQVLAVQSEKPDFATIRLILELCGDAEDFNADLEERGLPSCTELLTYADAREQEYNGNLEEACAAFRKISLLDSLDRATEIALALATAGSAPEPFSPVFGLTDADFAAAARALTNAAGVWTAASAPKNLSELPLSADEVIRLYRGLREGTSAPERDGREYRLRCPVDDLLAGSTPEAYVELYGADGAWADDLLTQVGTHTYTFSVPNDSRFDTVGEIRAAWTCDWPDAGGTGWNESLTAALVFREGEETAVETMLELQNCAFDIAWVPGRTLGGAASEGSVSVYLRDWQTGKRLGLEFSMNTGRLIDAADDPVFSAWENTSAQPKGHEWGEVKYDWAPDCGSCTAKRSCAICGYEDVETVSSTAAVTRQPTCAAMGETTYTARFTNSGFGTQERKLDNIPMTEHRWTPATYTGPERCTVCGLTRGTALLAIGNTMTFGHYEQDNNTANGKEEIEWIVLDVQGDRALLISKYALDCRKYNDTYTSVTWETCNLRNWLNGTFLYDAFSTEEQAKIPTVTVNADRNPIYSTAPGNSTPDRVFLLSVDEVNAYFSGDEARRCTPTAYARAQGCYVNLNSVTCRWWLRSPGHDSHNAAYVNFGGFVFAIGDYVNGVTVAVRPALWINLAS